MGIHRRGAVLGERLAEKLKDVAGHEIPFGSLDITLYKDDLTTVSHHPVHNATDIAFSVDGKLVLLVDDVLYTGRTTVARATGAARPWQAGRRAVMRAD